jgi:hypothetical protein
MPSGPAVWAAMMLETKSNSSVAFRNKATYK